MLCLQVVGSVADVVVLLPSLRPWLSLYRLFIACLIFSPPAAVLRPLWRFSPLPYIFIGSRCVIASVGVLRGSVGLPVPIKNRLAAPDRLHPPAGWSDRLQHTPAPASIPRLNYAVFCVKVSDGLPAASPRRFHPARVLAACLIPPRSDRLQVQKPLLISPGVFRYFFGEVSNDFFRDLPPGSDRLQVVVALIGSPSPVIVCRFRQISAAGRRVV